jgi:hypothetical protein
VKCALFTTPPPVSTVIAKGKFRITWSTSQVSTGIAKLKRGAGATWVFVGNVSFGAFVGSTFRVRFLPSPGPCPTVTTINF